MPMKRFPFSDAGFRFRHRLRLRQSCCELTQFGIRSATTCVSNNCSPARSRSSLTSEGFNSRENMTPDPESNLRLQIGHVLFIDLVGYSKLLIEEQKARLNKLTEVVLATRQVTDASNEQLVRLPTGDGMALVFRNSVEEPGQCALEITQALKTHPDIAVRMGIHSGPVSEVTDVSGRTN